VSYVASHTKTHAVKPPASQAARPLPAAERAPQPFESLIDDGAQAAAPPTPNTPPAKSEAAGKRGDESKAADAAPKTKPAKTEKTVTREPADSKATGESVDTSAQAGIDRNGPVAKPVIPSCSDDGKIESTDGKTKTGKKDGDGSKTDGKTADAMASSANSAVQPQVDKPVAIAAAVTTTVAAPAPGSDAAPSLDKTKTSVDAVKTAAGKTSVGPAPVDDDEGQATPAPQQADAKDAPKDHKDVRKDPLSVIAPQLVTRNKADQKTADASTKDATKDAAAQQIDGKPEAAVPDKQADAHARGEVQPDSPARGDAQTDAHRAAPAEAGKPAITAVANSPKPGGDAGQTFVLNAPPQSTPPAIGAAPAMPAATPAPQLPVPLAGLAVAIAARALPGMNHFDIRLDPPELGRIEVRLDVARDGRVTSHLIADRQDTLNLLQRDASDLQRAFQDAGLKTNDNGLQFSLRDQSGGTQQQEPATSPAARLIVEDDVPAPAAQTTYGQLARLRGGLDIRV
jgi:chemotaxis protein MotD